MKTRFITLSLVVILGIIPASFPSVVHAEPLNWLKIEKPGLRGNIVVSPSEVSDIAVGRGGTVYAIDSANSRVYYSTNGGSSWTNITPNLTAAGAILPASKIAVAPDSNSVVVVVSNNASEVYLSTDAGSTWDNTGVPALAGTIQTIAISRQYVDGGASLRDIAIGTAVWGNNTTTGQVWVRRQGTTVALWQNQALTVDPAHIGGEVSAIAYSPGYQRDSTILVVASTGSDVAAPYQNKTWLCLGQRNTSGTSTTWNNISGYPVEVATASSPSAGDDVGVLQITSSIALPSNYSSADDNLREVFVSYDRNPDANDDVYRLDDVTSYRLNVRGGANNDIRSIAYYGTTTAGKILAGDAQGVVSSPVVNIRRSSNPFNSAPTWNVASAPPSGPGNAILKWSSDGVSAFCGTGQIPGLALDESAFSSSTDNGDNWQQLSLVNTIVKLSDIAPVPDSDTLLVATFSLFGPEGIWRTATTENGIGYYWSRQLSMSTLSNRVIIRLSPNYAIDYTVYAIDIGGNLIAVSHNRGNTWKQHITPGNVIDAAVKDRNTIFIALPGGNIRKSINEAFTWDLPVITNLPEINMMTVTPNGDIIAGGRNGQLAYSNNDGDSFVTIPREVGTGDVQAVADSNYQQNHWIYAATDTADGGIWRWKISQSTSWQQVDSSITALRGGERICGLAAGSGGELYGLRLEPAGSNSGGITRSLNAAGEDVTDIEFDYINYSLPAGTAFNPRLIFANTMPYLKLSGDTEEVKLWAFDTVNEVIYQFEDTLVAKNPDLVSPPDSFQGKINPINGKTFDIVFGWNKPSDQVTGYELQIAADPDFAKIVKDITVNGTDNRTSSLIGPNTSTAYNFNAGAAYYWKVRVTGPVKSHWSATRQFSIEPSTTLPPVQTTTLPAPHPTITIQMPSSPVTISIPPPPPTPLPVVPDYVWGMMAIGSALVVVLVILIARTRR